MSISHLFYTKICKKKSNGHFFIVINNFLLQDKNYLEPYGKPRDIAYVVMAPENDHIVNATKMFFKELSNAYEMCKMGRHCPISKKLRDGIMRVGKNYAEKVSNESVDEWFQQIGMNNIIIYLSIELLRWLHELFLSDTCKL